MDVTFLSRLQFGLAIMFHYLFPPLTIGMGIILAYLEGMFLWKREAVYAIAVRFWTSLYAVTFTVGVATGMVREFQFGTNWAVYSRFVGDVFGSALAAKESSRSSSNPDFLPCSCSAGTRSGVSFISSQRQWFRSARSSQPCGSSSPTAGSKLPPAIESPKCCATRSLPAVPSQAP